MKSVMANIQKASGLKRLSYKGNALNKHTVEKR